jgi:hypothetical protein
LREKQGDPWDIWGDLEETRGNSRWQIQGRYRKFEGDTIMAGMEAPGRYGG